MRELPKYAILTGDGLIGIKVIMLEHPYIIASMFDINKDNQNELKVFQDDIAQARCPIAKVKGYTIYLKMYSSLKPCNNKELQQNVLNEMAEYVLREKISRKPGQYQKCEESGEWRRQRALARERRIQKDKDQQ